MSAREIRAFVVPYSVKKMDEKACDILAAGDK